MSKKIRYLIIALGFVFFLFAAPMIALYVTGQTYDFKTRQFVKTGLLALNTDPKSAKIYLNDKLARNGSGNIKFLPAGAYQITVKKDGYFDWTKRLEIKAGGVAWANPAGGKIVLFFKNPQNISLAEGVLDFFAGGGQIYYLNQTSLVSVSVSEPEQQEAFALPRAADKLLASPDGKTLLLTDSKNPATILVFDAGNQKFADISRLLFKPAQLDFFGSNELYGLEGGALYQIDWQKNNKIKLLDGIKTFSFSGKNLYYIRQNGGINSLMAAQAPYEESVDILNKVPDYKNGEIFVGFEKQILLLLDGTLYKVTSAAESIADGISQWDFNAAESAVSFVHNGELSYYNPADQTIDFVSRTALPLSNPRVSLAYGQAFLIRDNKVIASELDTRDNQNEYQLYSAKNAAKLVLGDDAKTLFVLDDGNLVMLEIR